MKKALASIVLASSLLASGAQAHDRGDIAAGIIGGLILGEMVNQFGQRQHQIPHYPPHYGPPAIIYAPPPLVIHSCQWTQLPVYDSWGRIITYRQYRVCQNY